MALVPISTKPAHGGRDAGDKWHHDELVIAIYGQKYGLWRAVDHHGFVIDIKQQSRRDKKVAKRLMKELLKSGVVCPSC